MESFVSQVQGAAAMESPVPKHALLRRAAARSSTRSYVALLLLLVAPSTHALAAKKAGGFGAAAPPKKKAAGITADKQSLEKQWDRFVSITNLDIMPKGDDAFSVVDVFVRGGKADGAPWWRVGKCCAGAGYEVAASLALQRGLIFWTAVHMRPELMAAGGRDAAAALELGYRRASLYMAVQEDGPEEADDDDDANPNLAGKCATARDTPPKMVGFRPDFNPDGFTYKRRETAALKKPSSRLEAQGLL